MLAVNLLLESLENHPQLLKEDFFDFGISQKQLEKAVKEDWHGILNTTEASHPEHIRFDKILIAVVRDIIENQNSIAYIDSSKCEEANAYYIVVKYAFFKEHYQNNLSNQPYNNRLQYSFKHEWIHCIDQNNSLTYFRHPNQSYQNFVAFSRQHQRYNFDFLFYALSQLRAEGITTLFETFDGFNKRNDYETLDDFEQDLLAQYRHLAQCFIATDRDKILLEQRAFNSLSYYTGKIVILQYISQNTTDKDTVKAVNDILQKGVFKVNINTRNAIMKEALNCTPEKFFLFILTYNHFNLKILNNFFLLGMYAQIAKEINYENIQLLVQIYHEGEQKNKQQLTNLLRNFLSNSTTKNEVDKDSSFESTQNDILHQLYHTFKDNPNEELYSLAKQYCQVANPLISKELPFIGNLDIKIIVEAILKV